MKKLNLNAIRIDGGTQPRERINMEAVGDYAEAVKVGIEFPPIVVFHDGAEYWLADGFHRWHAHKQADKASILADVRTGTLLDAKLHAVGANGEHGLRRSNADKRRAVEMVLAEDAWATWPEAKIAAACCVSRTLVRTILEERHLVEKQDSVREVTRGGTTYKQDTTAIGKGASKPAKAPAAPPPAPAPAPAPAALPPAAEDFGPSAEELASQEREEEAERAAFRLVMEADDKLAAAVAEVKRLTALVRVLEERNNGLMEEKAAAVSQANKWKRKHDRLEKAQRAEATS